jgi:hypothetical protein
MLENGDEELDVRTWKKATLFTKITFTLADEIMPKRRQNVPTQLINFYSRNLL